MQQQEIMINPVSMRTARTLQVICLPNSSPRRRIGHTRSDILPIYKSLNNYMNIYLCKHIGKRKQVTHEIVEFAAFIIGPDLMIFKQVARCFGFVHLCVFSTVLNYLLGNFALFFFLMRITGLIARTAEISYKPVSSLYSVTTLQVRSTSIHLLFTL